MHKLKKTSVKITKVIDCFFAKKFYSFNCLPQAVALLPYTVSLARNLLLANTYISYVNFHSTACLKKSACTFTSLFIKLYRSW